MSVVTEAESAGYADGYGDGLLEVGSGAPSMPMWSSRVVRLTDRHPYQESAIMLAYYHIYDYGWRDGAADALSEKSGSL